MDRGNVSGEEGAVWDDEVVAQALSELLLALRQDDASHLGLQLLRLISTGKKKVSILNKVRIYIK